MCTYEYATRALRTHSRGIFIKIYMLRCNRDSRKSMGPCLKYLISASSRTRSLAKSLFALLEKRRARIWYLFYACNIWWLVLVMPAAGRQHGNELTNHDLVNLMRVSLITAVILISFNFIGNWRPSSCCNRIRKIIITNYSVNVPSRTIKSKVRRRERSWMLKSSYFCWNGRIYWDIKRNFVNPHVVWHLKILWTKNCLVNTAFSF